VFCDVLLCSSARHFEAIWYWVSEARLRVAVGFSEQGGAFGSGISTLAAVAVLDCKIARLGRTAIYLVGCLFYTLVLLSVGG
jgi:hypothetical protein